VLDIAVPEAITVASEWNAEVEACLEAGGNVLLLAERLEEAEHLRFTPPFWNTQLFADQPKTLGLLCDPRHPALATFPTDFHSNWQWWELVHDAACFRFPAEPAAFRPIVQVIDHPIRNQKLGVLFEAQARRGKLLACSLDLRSDLARRPVARQLLASLLAYMQTPQFAPPCSLDALSLRELLHPRAAHYLSRHTVSVKADQEALGCEANKILDGEWSTFWATGNYYVQSSSYPHEIVIELDTEIEIDGFLYRPRQDGKREGWIASYAFSISADGHNWGEPLLQGTFQRNATQKEVYYRQGDDITTGARRDVGKFVRFVARTGFEGDMIAAIGAFDILTPEGEQ
jgi:hypothetical protein